MNDIISSLAVNAADNALVEKLASDTQISPDLVCHLASLVQMSPHAFVKAAYADPKEYVQFLKEAANIMPAIKGGISAVGRGLSGMKDKLFGSGAKGTPREAPNIISPGAASESPLISSGPVRSEGGAPNIVQKWDSPEIKTPAAPSGASGLLSKLRNYFGKSEATGTRFDRAMSSGILGGSRAGRNAQVALPLGAVGGSALTKGSDPAASASDAAGSGLDSGAGSFGEGSGGDFGGSSGGPAKTTSPTSSTSPVAKGGMSPALKALLAAGGIGAGALGVGAMANRGKSKKKKEVRSNDSATEMARQAIIKIAAAEYRKEAADRFCGYLDAVVSHMPLEKAAAVRRLQAAVSEGQPLSYAIKLAYPQLNGDQRGILAARLVKAAANAGASDFKTKKISGRTELSVKMKDGAVDKMRQMSS